MQTPPRQRIQTARLLLRFWDLDDAPLLMEAIGASLPELGQWTPWVIPEPFELTAVEDRIREFRRHFLTAQHFVYGVFDPDETCVLGAAGLYGRVGAGALEVGYWIRADATGRGYATEAARALTDVAFSECAADRVELRCDQNNAASAAIPRRLGFTLKELVEEDAIVHGGEPRRMMVWEMLAPDDWP